MQTQDPNQTKNLILAFALSIGVLVLWQAFYAGPKMDAERERQRAVATQQQSGAATNPAAADPSNPAASAAAGTLGQGPAIAATREVALSADGRVPVSTPSIFGSINLRGGRIDDVTLERFHETPDPRSPRVVIFSPSNAPDAYFAEHGFATAPGSSIAVPGADTVWSVADGARLTPQTPVELTWQNGQGLLFKRKISVDEDYLFTVRDTIENTGTAEVVLFPYARVFRYGTPKIEGFFIQHEGLIGVLGENEGFLEITYSGVREPGGSKVVSDAVGGWVGFTDKYWAAALIPDQTVPFRASMTSPQPQPLPGRRETFQADYLLPAVAVAPGTSASTANHVFVGAKKVDIIKRYEADLSIRQFELLIDWGWFYFITKPLYYLLDWLYKLVGNFGVAILLVTVIVKAVFFWFANKSYESMAKMKKLQPEMERIRDRFKDDKVEQQRRLMELYQKEKINPLAGCLPVLVQIPVFFALYKVLFISIDMRHAPFFGWIQDLSAPDPTSLFNLFGLLPYAMPDWFPPLGIWPIIMGVTMWLQMQLNPQQPDPIQQAIFNWMPVVFTFLLASFPAGLVIYWAWNNILSLAQQYLIMKRQGVDVHLMDNLRRTASAAKRAGGAVKRTAGGSAKGRET
ncbi:MAG: membrane protein insertase YidC [Hyphomicrobiaceae bacterium]